MRVKIKDLIVKLQEQQDQEREIEYIVCDMGGALIAASVGEQASSMAKMLKVFKS